MSGAAEDVECPVCFETNVERIMCHLPCKHDICIKCTFILEPALCPLCRYDFSKTLEVVKEFSKKVKDVRRDAPMFTPTDFPPLG